VIGGPPCDSCAYIDSMYRSHYADSYQTVTVAAAMTTDPPFIEAPFLCPIPRSLDILGDRRTILILRDLVVSGARRFQDFEQSLKGISPTTLSARLKRLEEAGVVERRFYEQHPPRAEYLLTDRGKDLRPVLKALLQWGKRYTKYAAGQAS